jgi:cysteine-rich repeat protein
MRTALLMAVVMVAGLSGCTILTGAFQEECGDGFIQQGESCDDGNTLSGDGCSAGCQLEEECGDGIRQLPEEECDDGNLEPGDGCDAACQGEELPLCGDGTLQAGEQCDDGNIVSGDGCNAFCGVETNGVAALTITPVADPSLLDPASADFLRAYVGGEADAELHGFHLVGVGAGDDDPAPTDAVSMCWQNEAGQPAAVPFASGLDVFDAATLDPLGTDLEPDANGCVTVLVPGSSLEVGEEQGLLVVGDITPVTSGGLVSEARQRLVIPQDGVTNAAGIPTTANVATSAPRFALAGAIRCEAQTDPAAVLANNASQINGGRVRCENFGATSATLERAVIEADETDGDGAQINGMSWKLGAATVTTPFGCSPKTAAELCFGFVFDIAGEEQVFAPGEVRIYDLVLDNTANIEVNDEFTFILREGRKGPPAIDGLLFSDADGQHAGEGGLVSGSAFITN